MIKNQQSEKHIAVAEKQKTSILIIYTGGTIGMDQDAETGSLVPFDFNQIEEKVPELNRFDFDLTVHSMDPLIDSSDITSAHWSAFAELIEENYDRYDSFVILHGTDTMAYSASALSFMLENLRKPVIFTGSQLPIGEPRTDARENLISALEMAEARAEDGSMLLQEVCICFDSKLLRGNRSKKVQSFNFTAFKSYNYPVLAEAGIHIEYYPSRFWRAPKQGELKVYRQMDDNVIIVKIFPGMTSYYLYAVLSVPNLRGVVLETYGSGNTPTGPWVAECLKRAIDRGVVIVNVSQCTGGYVSQGLYAASVHLERIGVVGGADMTTEAAVGKLMHLLGCYTDPEKVKQLMKKDLRGELNIDLISQ